LIFFFVIFQNPANPKAPNSAHNAVSQSTVTTLSNQMAGLSKCQFCLYFFCPHFILNLQLIIH